MNLKKFDLRVYLTPKQIAGYILSCLLPLAVLVLGILLLCLGLIFSPTYLIAFVLLPCAAFAWNFALVRSKTSVGSKVFRIILLLVVFWFAFEFSLFFGELKALDRYHGSSVNEPYSAVLERCDSLPEISELGTPEKIEYHDYYAQQFIFGWKADTLICRYGEEEYAQQKALLDEKYIFQSDALTYDEYICQPTAEIDDYHFRMLSVEGTYYPKEVCLIATNDDTREIVYLYFYDPDIDYIPSLPDFINDYCGWKHIR